VIWVLYFQIAIERTIAQRIPSLKHSPMTVLPLFYCLTSHQLVLYEVVVQVGREFVGWCSF
jgi:hypothetical protein